MIILLVLAAIAVFVAYRALHRSGGAAIEKARGRLLWYSLIVLAVVLLLKINLVAAVIAALAALLSRLLPYAMAFLPLLERRRAQAAGAESGGSEVQTAFLRVTFDARDGHLDGIVLQGDFAGRPLNSLSLEESRRLYRALAASDAQSGQLLAAYLNRRFHAAWRDDGSARAEEDIPLSGNLSHEQALAVLGLRHGATSQQIVQAHRRLMQKLHPDRGGSDLLAAMLNRAKDVLLQHG